MTEHMLRVYLVSKIVSFFKNTYEQVENQTDDDEEKENTHTHESIK
jgi:hypothetical protein